MTIIVRASDDPTNARLRFRDLEFRCAIGAGGTTSKKREGDQCTPLGTWPLRRVFYRPDKPPRPDTRLPRIPMTPTMGWSDDPADPPHYNRLVELPYPHGHEVLWRDDRVYDIVVELGYNDNPPVIGRGSAIFMHVAKPDFAPTAGCVALATDDLRHLLTLAAPGECLEVTRIGPYTKLR